MSAVDKAGANGKDAGVERIFSMPELNYLLVATWNPRAVLRYDAATLALTDTFANLKPGDPLTQIVAYLTGLEFGPDGDVYAADWEGSRVARFWRENGTPRADFVPKGTGGLVRPGGLVFGPDGNLYVANRAELGSEEPTGEILRFHGQTGAFLGAFVPGSANGGLKRPFSPIFGPDGHLYVCDHADDRVMRYDGTTGSFLGEFVPERTAGLRRPTGHCFGADGNLYVLNDDRLLRFEGATGAFMDEFIGPAGGILEGKTLRVGPDGNFYVASMNSGEVLIFSPTGVKVNAIKVLKGNEYLPTTLAFGRLPMPIRLPDVPRLWQRVPRWLQVIGAVLLGLAVAQFVARALQPGNRRR